jgi:hypothetical protein
MAFDGNFPASDLYPAPGGVLSVAEVVEHGGQASDDRWVRQFSQEFDSQPSYVRLLTVNDEVVAAGELADNEGSLRYFDYVPFFIDVEDFASTFGILGQNRFDRVLKQLDVVSQKALEYELWEGAAAQAETAANGNMYLRKSGASTVPVSGAKKPENALMFLEQALSNSSLGGKGVIHMTRDVASILGSRLIYVKKDDGSKKIITRLGTKVVVGSGYTGNGPLGDANAAASATNKWMYATGPIYVHLGKSELVHDDLSQGVNATINDMRIKASRPAAVYADPSMLFAMRVTLPND